MYLKRNIYSTLYIAQSPETLFLFLDHSSASMKVPSALFQLGPEPTNQPTSLAS